MKRFHLWPAALAGLALLLAPAPAAWAGAVRANAGFRNSQVPRNDDGSSALVQIGFTINFFGKNRTNLYVNNNGNLTLDQPLSTFTPFGLTRTAREIIAPFFGDVDTRGAGSSLVTYGNDVVNGHAAFGANYVNVGYYTSHDDKLNSFQVILIDRSDTGPGNFDIEFNYDRIAWETGDASGGSGGFGGTPATAGFSNGTGDSLTFYELPGSLTSGAFLDGGPRSLVRNHLNTTTAGRYIFRARSGLVLPGLTVLSGGGTLPAVAGQPLSQQLIAAGADPPYRWELIPDPGVTMPGVTLSPDGVLSGTPNAVGTYTFTIRVTGQTEEGPQTVATRGVLIVNPPSLQITTACPLPSGVVSMPYAASFAARGGTGGYVWSLEDGLRTVAPGLTFNANGTISGVPTTPGTYQFAVRAAVADSQQASPSVRQCSLTIAPVALTLPDRCVTAPATSGVPYSSALQTLGGVGPFTWSATGLLPPGVILTQDGTFTGLPTTAGVYPVNVKVTDRRSQTATQLCRVTVSEPSLSVVMPSPLPDGVVGETYAQVFSAQGGAGPYRWSVLGTLPAGLSLTEAGGLQGTPSASGSHSFRLLVRDSQGAMAGQPATLTVYPKDLYISTACPLPTGVLSQSYRVPLRAAFGVEPLVWSVTGSLPPGLGLQTDGTLAGLPTTSGRYEFTLRLADGRGKQALKACSLAVSATQVMLSNACPLPNGQTGTAYNQRLTASGGTLPYTFSATGNLPAGLRLTGEGTLTGTPSALGQSSFQIRATDAHGQVGTQDCGMTVTLPPVPEIKLSELPSTIAPASTNVQAVVQLSQAYAYPMRGRLSVAVTPDTGSGDGAVDRADPRVRFMNGQPEAAFTIPAGQRQVVVPLASTGTVASTVTFQMMNLQVGGANWNNLPVGRQFRVARLLPVLTDACYTQSGTTGTLKLTGYSTTRELNRANVVLNGAASQAVDLQALAGAYFSDDDSVRFGGAFSLTAPFTVAAGTTINSATVSLTNSLGTTAARTMSRCQ